MTTAKEIEELNTRLSNSKPTDIIQEASKLWPNLAISFSGAEDVALIDMASKLIHTPAIFTLDTGRLHGQTYEFIESVRKHYELPIETLHPNPKQLSRLIQDKGLFSFYEDGHEEC